MHYTVTIYHLYLMYWSVTRTVSIYLIGKSKLVYSYLIAFSAGTIEQAKGINFENEICTVYSQS